MASVLGSCSGVTVLLNPATANLSVIPGTRMLEDALGLSGAVVPDPHEPWRHWTIQWLLAPIPGRHLGGVRAKLIDTKGFVTFCNQRDLEVLMQHGKPGQYCQWTGKNYVSPNDSEWCGLCCDEEDLRDDLFERECRAREHYKEYPYLPQGLEFTRRLHLELNQDVEELYTLLWDMDPDTYQYPDTSLRNVQRRWSRVERLKLFWERIP